VPSIASGKVQKSGQKRCNVLTLFKCVKWSCIADDNNNNNSSVECRHLIDLAVFFSAGSAAAEQQQQKQKHKLSSTNTYT